MNASGKGGSRWVGLLLYSCFQSMGLGVEGLKNEVYIKIFWVERTLVSSVEKV